MQFIHSLPAGRRGVVHNILWGGAAAVHNFFAGSVIFRHFSVKLCKNLTGEISDAAGERR